MKELAFIADSYKQFISFPQNVKSSLGYDLHLVQSNEIPRDWKPMPSIGQGVCELRHKDVTGAFRVIYYAKLKDSVYILHAFQKKSKRLQNMI